MLTSRCGARSYGRHRRLRKARLRECESAKTNPLNAVIPRLFSSTLSVVKSRLNDGDDGTKAMSLFAIGRVFATCGYQRVRKQTHLSSQTQGVFQWDSRQTSAPPSVLTRISS